MIGVVVVNFATPPEPLERMLAALAASLGLAADDVEIVLVDNGSPRFLAEGRAVAARFDGRPFRVRFVEAGRNLGFAGGVNFGVTQLDPRVDLVYLCNPDAVVEPEVLRLLGDTLRTASRSTVSAAPKMLLDLPTELAEAYPVLDGLGVAVNAKGEAFNVGLGQPDLGQYDKSISTMGPSFGAAMIRRSAFDGGAVGPLEESFFMYYDDVDWNWRAQLLGFDAVRVPAARVHHSMSITMRDRPYGDKFHLTERNLMLCALRNLDNPWPVLARRMAGLLKGSLTGRHYPVAGLRAISGTLRRAPRILRARAVARRRHTRSNADILAFAAGEQTFYDPVAYRPTDRDAALAFAQQRADR